MLKLHHIQVTETEVRKAAANFFKSAQELLPAPIGILDSGITHVVIHKLVNPRYDRSFFSPSLIDFVEVWSEVVLSKFGSVYEGYFSALLDELRKHSLRLRPELPEVEESPLMGEDPTETELQWLLVVVKHLMKGREAPGFPLAKGPKHRKVQRVSELVRTSDISKIRQVLTESIILLHRYKKVKLSGRRMEVA